MAIGSTFASLSILLYCLILFCVNATTNKEFLRIGQSMGISDTIISYGGSFELGFFSRTRETSTKYYIGIWFKKVPNDKIVWVANRDYAFQTSSAVLTIQHDGNIVITDGPMSYLVNRIPNNYSTYARLLDSGNLVLLNNSNQAILWQSFDNPTDTLLPGMNIGHDEEFGNTWSLRSWKNADDPAPGAFSREYNFGLASLIVNKGSNVFWIDGRSNVSIQGVIDRIGMAENMSYFTLPGDSNSRVVLEVSGELNHQYWSEETKRWVTLQSSKCGTNNSCGSFSICNPQALDPCECLTGFEPFHADSWRQGNKSAGCVRKEELSCSNTSSDNNDGFLRLDMVELPANELMLKMDTARRCERTCYSNCSCVGCAYDFSGNCLLWFDQVLSLKNISTDVEEANNKHPSFSLRLAPSELVNTVSNTMNAFGGRKNRMRNLLLIVVPISFLTLLIPGLFVYWTRRQRRKEDLLHFKVGMSMKVKDLEFPEVDKAAKVKRKEVIGLYLETKATNNH